MNLDDYLSKRDADATPEPTGGDAVEGKWVIQEHDASSHHYDLRLAAGGVLASWAVPKGPSTDPSERRLAMRTEDHPTDYLNFEGTIPEGEYGAGPVIVWDTGEYRNLTTDDEGKEIPPEKAIEAGHIAVWLDGDKLSGGYALTHTDGDRWILVKMDDAEADARRNPTSTEPESVLSGRRLDELSDDE